MASYDRHLLDGEHLGHLVSKIKTLVSGKQDEIPTVVVTLDKVISLDPLQVQLTEEEFGYIANNPFVFVDSTELGIGGGCLNTGISNDGEYLLYYYTIGWSSGEVISDTKNVYMVDSDTKIVTMFSPFEITRDDVDYWNDKAERDLDATEGNIAVFDSDGNTEDSGYGVEEATSVPIVTEIDSSSTNSEIPGAKAVYDLSRSTLNEAELKILTKTTIDSVLIPHTCYILGTQSTLSLILPTTAELGQQIEVVFSSGATACTLTCSLTGFDFVPKANTTNKIVFELIHKADTSITGDEDVWSVEIKEG